MALTQQQRAEIKAAFKKIKSKPLPKPKVVADDLGPIRDADVHVSRVDPNGQGQARVVQVRRPEWVTINFDALDQQMRASQRAFETTERRQRRDYLDPYGIGLYGPNE